MTYGQALRRAYFVLATTLALVALAAWIFGLQVGPVPVWHLAMAGAGAFALLAILAGLLHMADAQTVAT